MHDMKLTINKNEKRKRVAKYWIKNGSIMVWAHSIQKVYKKGKYKFTFMWRGGYICTCAHMCEYTQYTLYLLYFLTLFTKKAQQQVTEKLEQRGYISMA